MMADYLEKTLCGDPAFSVKVQRLIRKDMATLRSYQCPHTEDDLYDRLIAHAVAYCRLHPSLIPKPENPRLRR